MVTGGLSFVFAAYALTVAVLGALAIVVMVRAKSWSRADQGSSAPDQEA